VTGSDRGHHQRHEPDDGLDGLASRIGCIIGATLTFIAFQADEAVGVFTGLAFLARARLPALQLSPARIFLGDTGALFIGFNLAARAQGYGSCRCSPSWCRCSHSPVR
jgi:hypothetical protein